MLIAFLKNSYRGVAVVTELLKIIASEEIYACRPRCSTASIFVGNYIKSDHNSMNIMSNVTCPYCNKI